VRFLVDESAGPTLARWLADQGHSVFSVFDEARGTSDSEIIQKAFGEDWIIVTADTLC
jgi:predicted nuclease of predicted toxin-antitoxin system